MAQKWVRVMCDFGAEGVWDKQGCCCCADDLPVAADLIARIHEWQKRYDVESPSAATENYVPYSFDVISFSQEGLSIATAVKAALPDWTVVYFDEAKYQQAPHRTDRINRSDFEYEIGT